VQPDLKKLVAYSSVSHMGLIVLGIFSFTTQGLQGSVIQMLNHGLSTGALFLLVGMLYDRRHTRKIADFGGLAHIMPVYASIFLFVTLSSIGLPGLNGVVGEVLILLGSFARNKVLGSLAALSMVLGAIYMLWMYQRVFLGKLENQANASLKDMGTRERLLLLPIIILMLWIGVYSKPFLSRIEPSIQRVQDRIENAKRHEGSYYVKRLSPTETGSERTK
jgi:NADH-quinone oxidoreductase subunit M